MPDDDIDRDAEFADNPDYRALSPSQRDRRLSVMEKMIDTGMAAIYGDKDPDLPDARIDCAHLDRGTLACTVRDERPLRCRRYDCHDDAGVCPEGVPAALAATFPGKEV